MSDRRTLMEHVADLQVLVQHALLTRRGAADELRTRWDLTEVGALDLIDNGYRTTWASGSAVSP